ncbi:MAG: ATP-binding protein [Oscillospiraceae bacterium]
MKIKSVSCTQFAGVRDRSISFEDGINVIYGKNESGKSTLVNLISRTLFQNARIDGRSDKAFRELYYPGARRGSSVVGDFADGKITLEAADGTYTLTKEWGADARCVLSSPGGAVKEQKKIDELLKSVLVYGEGVYADMLFSSQRNTDLSVQTILDSTKTTDAKQEITDAVSRAFAESGGISVSAIEQAVNAQIERLAGKHWDFNRDMPVRKASRWSTGLGEILSAYYALLDAEKVLSDISSLEEEADRTAADFAAKDEELRKSEESCTAFSDCASRLAVLSERRNAIERLSRELEKASAILCRWPQQAELLDRARALREESASRALLDKYDTAKKLSDELSAITAMLSERPCPSADEISAVKEAQRIIASCENKLCGMNLCARLKMIGGNPVEIKSLVTGEPVEVSDCFPLTEAVSITIPDVMELTLSPADVDAASVTEEITKRRTAMEDILTRYGADSIPQLEQLSADNAAAKAKRESAALRLSAQLGDTSFEELEAAAKAVCAPVRTKEAIEKDIAALCPDGNLDRHITVTETHIRGYEEEYGDIRQLNAKVLELQAELQKAESSLSAFEDIPDEYMKIADPESHLAALKQRLKQIRDIREAALTEKTSAASRLEGFKNSLSGDPAEQAERAQRVFGETKALLKHWLHIAEVLRAQKEKISDAPMRDIAESFTKYLGIVTDGRVSSEFPYRDRLNVSVYSDDRLLDYTKLSEGTKETVSLAFRLAVLDHLFPEGGGVIIFDDPFNDMDADRAARSCELIRECAKRHQVIFLTCKEEYLEIFSGNGIRI